MTRYLTTSRRTALLAASMFAATSMLLPSVPAGAETVSWGGDEKSAEDDKPQKRRTIRVISSGGHGGSDTSEVRIVRHVAKNREAIEQAKAALGDVMERLQRADSDEERRALEAAREGLETAIESLERQRVNHIVVGPSQVELRHIEAEALEDALAEMSEQQQDLYGMRRDLQQEIEEARREIADALGDVEMELDLDGDLRTLRIQSLRAAETSLEDYEERHLQAIKRAEADLKRERERLERRLEKRRAEQKDADKE